MTQTADRVELIEPAESGLTDWPTLSAGDLPNATTEVFSYGTVPWRIGQAIGGFVIAVAPSLISPGLFFISIMWGLVAVCYAWNRLTRPYEVQVSGSRLEFTSVFGRFALEAADIYGVVTQTRLSNGKVRQVQIKHAHGMSVIDADSDLIAQRIGQLNRRVQHDTERYDDTD